MFQFPLFVCFLALLLQHLRLIRHFVFNSVFSCPLPVFVLCHTCSPVLCSPSCLTCVAACSLVCLLLSTQHYAVMFCGQSFEDLLLHFVCQQTVQRSNMTCFVSSFILKVLTGSCTFVIYGFEFFMSKTDSRAS